MVWELLTFLSSGGKSSLRVSVPGHLFLFLHLCFFSCNDVDRSINSLTENYKVILFKVVGLLTWIFSFADKLIGERGVNSSFKVGMY